MIFVRRHFMQIRAVINISVVSIVINGLLVISDIAPHNNLTVLVGQNA